MLAPLLVISVPARACMRAATAPVRLFGRVMLLLYKVSLHRIAPACSTGVRALLLPLSPRHARPPFTRLATPLLPALPADRRQASHLASPREERARGSCRCPLHPRHDRFVRGHG
jgi:hypothetical protein